MGKFDGCLLASDIDGTLMDDGYINPKNIEKINYFMSEGGCFSLATGRSIAAMSDILAQLKNFSPSVVANGCMIYDYAKNITVYQKTLCKQDYRIVKVLMESGIDIGVEIHCEEKVFSTRRNYNSDLHQKYEHFCSVDIELEDAYNYKWNKVLYTFRNHEDLLKAKALVEKEEILGCDFVETCATIDGELQNYYEQIPKNANKATGLSKLCEILKIKPDKLFVIGDYYNDLTMIKMAAISASPENAPEAIKNQTNVVVCNCKSGAVAEFIDYLSNNMLG